MVPRTVKLNPVKLVKPNTTVLPFTETPVNFEWSGAGMLNEPLVTLVRPLEVNEMVAPVTELVLNAFRPVKEAVPATADFVVVPLSDQVACTGAAVMLAVLATGLPDASSTITAG